MLLALDGAVTLVSASGRRDVAAADLFVGANRTAMRPDELAVDVRLPVGHLRTTFLESSRRHNDLPLAGVAASIHLDDEGVVTSLRLAVGSAAGPRRMVTTEPTLVGARPDAEWCAAGASAVELELATGTADPPDGASRHTHHVAGVLVRRALTTLTTGAG